MRTLRNWWWVPLVALIAVVLKAAILTPWVASQAEDAVRQTLEAEGLDTVEFVSIDGVERMGLDGLTVVLAGPASDRSLAIAAIQGRDEIGQVRYRSNPAGSEEGGN